MPRDTRRIRTQTGPQRYLVTFADGTFAEGVALVDEIVIHPALPELAAPGAEAPAPHDQPRSLAFPGLGVAVMVTRPEAGGNLPLEAVAAAPTQIVEAVGPLHLPVVEVGHPPSGGRWIEDSESTWGMKAIGASGLSGKGVRVAILDTGFGPCSRIDSTRIVAAKSFHPLYPGDTSDGNGHGTACAAIACGRGTETAKRFGVAFEAELLIGRVASAVGSSQVEYVLAGLEWALEHGAQVVSMSLGFERGVVADASFAWLARRALDSGQGAILIAAAGNDRPETVVSPASAQGVLAVAAIDHNEQLYPRSCPSGRGPGQQVDFAAPGVDIFIPTPDDSPLAGFVFRSGTSFAAPHLAGIAALMVEKHKGNVRAALAELVPADLGGKRELSPDIGRGLIQAPQPVT